MLQGMVNALVEAASGGHVEAVALLLDRGADVNQEDVRRLAPGGLSSRLGEVAEVRVGRGMYPAS